MEVTLLGWWPVNVYTHIVAIVDDSPHDFPSILCSYLNCSLIKMIGVSHLSNVRVQMLTLRGQCVHPPLGEHYQCVFNLLNTMLSNKKESISKPRKGSSYLCWHPAQALSP